MTRRTFRAPSPAQELARSPRDRAPVPGASAKHFDDRVGLIVFDTWRHEKRVG
ncbi:MAG TPA: hypothetical protein VKE73_11480 [Myxococcota bacterium]|nr:hypothetical protein [Myxococcota bacterium]